MKLKKKLIIANWKMKLTSRQSLDLAQNIKAGFKSKESLQVVLCPSFTALCAVSQIIKNTEIKLGAQDVFYEDQGAYTGEISAQDLQEIGASYVIIGHSERRAYLNETDEIIHKKIKNALDNKLIPILCVGENFEQRQEGQTDYVILKQVKAALEGINLVNAQNLVIAYEPVWVIGSGQAVEPKQAEHVNKVIFQALIDLFPVSIVKNNVHIIYGGSVDSGNASRFLSQPAIEGVLVGGASLQPGEFLGIYNF